MPNISLKLFMYTLNENKTVNTFISINYIKYHWPVYHIDTKLIYVKKSLSKLS